MEDLSGSLRTASHPFVSVCYKHPGNHRHILDMMLWLDKFGSMAIWWFSFSGRPARLGTLTCWHRSQQIFFILMSIVRIQTFLSTCHLPRPWRMLMSGLPGFLSSWPLSWVLIIVVPQWFLNWTSPHNLKLDWITQNRGAQTNSSWYFQGFLEQCLVFPVPSVNGRRWMPRMFWPASSGNQAVTMSRWKRITSPPPRSGVRFCLQHLFNITYRSGIVKEHPPGVSGLWYHCLLSTRPLTMMRGVSSLKSMGQGEMFKSLARWLAKSDGQRRCLLTALGRLFAKPVLWLAMIVVKSVSRRTVAWCQTPSLLRQFLTSLIHSSHFDRILAIEFVSWIKKIFETVESGLRKTSLWWIQQWVVCWLKHHNDYFKYSELWVHVQWFGQATSTTADWQDRIVVALLI